MIHVDNLTKFYDGFCAVDGISLDIQKGEILGLLGPNGAGKTTTLKMLTGYFPPTSGTIAIKDLNINEHLLEIKQMIGYLPESSPFYKDLLVYDYLDYVAKIRGIPTSERHTRIKYLADLCGLNPVMHKAIGELSKGLNQRVGLAHAMMRDPEILILDEPTQGLDPNQIVEIRKIIRKIGEEKTVIFSTHILSEAEATCDRIVIINRGRIVADGETENLKQSAGRESTIQITLENAAFDAVSQTLKPIDGVESVEKIDQTDDGRVSVKVACRSESDRREEIYKAIKNTDWVLLEFYQETQTLETIFSDLTRQINKEN
jgi:ABC-2 type transport system ATP-binding protein